MTCTEPPLCITVPRVAALTPDPAVAFVTPLGKQKGRPDLQALAGTWKFARRLDDVQRLAAHQDRPVLGGPCRHNDVLHLVTGDRSGHAADEHRGRQCSNGQSDRRHARELRRVGNRPLWMPPCMLRSSLVSIGIVPVLRMRSRIGFHGRPSFALSPAGAAGASGGGAVVPSGAGTAPPEQSRPPPAPY